MKHSTVKLKISILTIVLVFSSIIMAGQGFSQTIKKVAVCPLEMNSTENLSFLQKGLFSMFSSRLFDPGKVEVLERQVIDQALAKAQNSSFTKGTLNESKARLIGAGLGVDYILFGSLTMFGQSVSLDTTMVDVKGEKPTLTFSKQAAEQGAVITELDKIASEINLKTFGRAPEQILPNEEYARRPQIDPEGGEYSSPLKNYRTLFFANGHINGLSVADFDGDKNNEIVIIYDHAIEILKESTNGKLKAVKRIEEGQHTDIIGVDTADINKNGKAEIFISRVNRQNGYLLSSVLEYDGSNYKEIVKKLPWYFRAVKNPYGKKILYAQKSGKEGPYKGRNVFRVEWQNNAPIPGDKLLVPSGFSILGMALGYWEGSVSNILFTDKTGQLVLLNSKGRREWEGGEGYGGSKLFYKYVEKSDLIMDDARGKGEFFQPRSIIVADEQGKINDVVIIKNEEVSNNLFENTRNYKKGSIEILKWSEMGLLAEKAPKRLPGQITDIALGDYDNNSKEELIITVIKKRNNFSPKKSKSMIIAYDL